MSGDKDGKTVCLRIAVPEDARALLRLIKALRRESNTIFFSRVTVEEEVRLLTRLGAASEELILLAVFGEQLIGLATVRLLQDGARAGELGIAVRKPYWHQGIGSLLLDELIYWFLNYSNLDHLVLDVYRSNVHALKLYQQYGFVETGHLILQDANGAAQPAISMEYQRSKD